MDDYSASYLGLLESNELKKRVYEAYHQLTHCRICAHECGINRMGGDVGFCGTGSHAIVSSYGRHLGEEYPIRGERGSGTIFFSRCNLHCQYCQNSDISQAPAGDEIDAKDLAYIMLEIQGMGCHNINLVSPSHVVPQILAGLFVAAKAGLNIPLVYNTGGYDHLNTLNLLDGIIDIYMPDMKYANDDIGKKYSGISDYPKVNQSAVIEMHKQVSDLSCDKRGIAYRGLLIRHLILPNNIESTRKILSFISNNISKNTYINLMDQYHPAYNAYKFPELNRRITKEEYDEALKSAKSLGLNRLDQRRSSFFFY